MFSDQRNNAERKKVKNKIRNKDKDESENIRRNDMIIHKYK